MGKTTIFTALLFLSLRPLSAQDDLSIKHVKGLHAVSASFLATGEGKGAALGYWRFLADRLALDTGAEFGEAKAGFTSYTDIRAYAKAHFTLAGIKETAYLSIFAGGRLGHEKASLSGIGDPAGAFPDVKRFAASAGAGLSAEIYILRELAVPLSFEQVLLAKHRWWQAQAGIRYYLN